MDLELRESARGEALSGHKSLEESRRCQPESRECSLGGGPGRVPRGRRARFRCGCRTGSRGRGSPDQFLWRRQTGCGAGAVEASGQDEGSRPVSGSHWLAVVSFPSLGAFLSGAAEGKRWSKYRRLGGLRPWRLSATLRPATEGVG